jgi:hypothetical protein
MSLYILQIKMDNYNKIVYQLTTIADEIQTHLGNFKKIKHY